MAQFFYDFHELTDEGGGKGNGKEGKEGEGGRGVAIYDN